MRCYFMRASRIEGVELLKPAPDPDLIRQAKELFDARNSDGKYDGFEVWELNRFVYRSRQADPSN
jgi:hypothetical protein